MSNNTNNTNNNMSAYETDIVIDINLEQMLDNAVSTLETENNFVEVKSKRLRKISSNEVISTNEIKELKVKHKCPNCENLCFGKQCSDCHVKMLETNKGNCIDCKEEFNAMRNDGTKRKRCLPCQTLYNSKHISTCKFCTKSYHALLDDGRYFDRCFDCYQKFINTKCDKCGNKSFGQKFCKPCYEFSKNERQREREEKEKQYSYDMHQCKTRGCNNDTTFTYCKSCFIRNKDTMDTYMISTCRGCGFRSKGDFSYCNRCRDEE